MHLALSMLLSKAKLKTGCVTHSSHFLIRENIQAYKDTDFYSFTKSRNFSDVYLSNAESMATQQLWQ